MGSDDGKGYPTMSTPSFVPSKERRAFADDDIPTQGKSNYGYGDMEKAKKKAEVSAKLRTDEKNPSTESCCMPFLGTRLLVSKYDREEYIRTTLAELAIYAVYLTVTCMITYGLTISSSYYYSNVVSNLFLNTPIRPPEGTTFRTSSKINDFWAVRN
ncbi:unnamed protein product [Orchesella dallaii]|uniref:Uncharacterized protein n=1 Tax=Orchesella dallaii TaxID=48710 RepID=A0ABP1S5Z1_9HEXA